MGISDSSGPQASQHNSSAPPHKVPFNKGDFIGQKYEVYDVLGEGGFGIVYLVYSQEMETVYALKTFRDECLEDKQTRNRFRKEAEVWINLERYPYLVRAYLVDEISGRLYIAMEHIASDEQGLNSLDAYLKRRPPDLAQSLRWAIQFCYGMEYAYSKGIKAHRDIKPSNIMIDQNKTVKISDFGLAGIFQQESIISEQGIIPVKTKNDTPMQTAIGTSIGTPEYMSPEQFTDFSACDERSDIYSFGIVLYQMTSGGRLPFSADNPDLRWTALKYFHHETPVPKLKSPLFPIIFRCLEKKPINRYFSCKELRRDLEALLKKHTGEIVKLPELKELEAWDWYNKGVALRILGKDHEAIACYDRALEISPEYTDAWINKGMALGRLGKDQEEIVCYNEALEINPRYATAWYNKGTVLGRLGKDQEEIFCYDKALEINPGFVSAWLNKGVILGRLGKEQEAIICYDKALEINPRHADAWIKKGIAEHKLNRTQEVIFSFKQFLRLASADDSKIVLVKKVIEELSK